MSEKAPENPESPTPAGPQWREIVSMAGKRAFRGGLAGSAAMVINIFSLMWLRTIMNYQYRNGVSTTAAMRHLFAEGGIPRFYKGLVPALFQGPLSRFGDTAANVGMLQLLDSIQSTQRLPVFAKTMCASLAAAGWRIALMPIDTCKTYMQVEGSFASLVNKVRVSGFRVLFHGALGAFGATYVGHFPWFFTNNFLSAHIPKTDHALWKFGRHATIGFLSSVVSDSISNSIRVCKVYKQSSTVATSYPRIVRSILASEGVSGLMFRGLKTRLISNGCQGIMFNVAWKYFMEIFMDKK